MEKASSWRFKLTHETHLPGTRFKFYLPAQGIAALEGDELWVAEGCEEQSFVEEEAAAYRVYCRAAHDPEMVLRTSLDEWEDEVQGVWQPRQSRWHFLLDSGTYPPGTEYKFYLSGLNVYAPPPENLEVPPGATQVVFNEKSSGWKWEKGDEAHPALAVSALPPRSSGKGLVRAAVGSPKSTNGDGGDPPPPPLPVPWSSIDAVPASLSGAQPGVALLVTGSWRVRRVETPNVSVTVSGQSDVFVSGWTATGSDSLNWWGTWSATVNFYNAGAQTVASSADGQQPAAKSTEINVTLADTEPLLTIVTPLDDQDIPLNPTGMTLIPFQLDLGDGTCGPRLVSWTDDLSAHQISGVPSGTFTSGTALVNTYRVNSSPIDGRPLVFSCDDGHGHSRTAQIYVRLDDVTPPDVEIAQPEEYIPVKIGNTIPLAISAQDGQSGVASVEWAVFGGGVLRTSLLRPPRLRLVAITRPRSRPSLKWGCIRSKSKQLTARVIRTLPLSLYGSSPTTFPSASRTVSASEITSGPSSLSRSSGLATTSASVGVGDLEATFGQPFSALSEPAPGGDSAEDPINELVPVVRILRKITTDSLLIAQGAYLLAGRWTFMPSGAGGPLDDLSGNGNAATLQGGATVDATTDGLVTSGRQYAMLADSKPLHLGHDDIDFSICLWIRLDAQTAAGQRTLLWVNQSYEAHVWAKADASGGLTLQVAGLGVPVANLPSGTWAHLALVEREPAAPGTPQRWASQHLGDPLAHQLRPGPLYIGGDPDNDSFSGATRDLQGFGFALSDLTIGVMAGTGPEDPPAQQQVAATAEYRLAAYNAVLAGAGTSWDDLRFANDDTSRQAVANQLGVTADLLGQLTLRAADFGNASTDATLTQLFGLADVAADATAVASPARRPGRSRSSVVCDLGRSRQSRGPRFSPPVVVDPDIITAGDFTVADSSNVAYALWSARQDAVQSLAAQLHALRPGPDASQQAPLAAMISTAIPGGDLANPDTTLVAPMATAGLPPTALPTLERAGRLAVIDQLLSDDWDDIEAILTQVMKSGLYHRPDGSNPWALEEQNKGVVLSPKLFTLNSGNVSLPAWRADPLSRNTWEAILQARTHELASSRATWQFIVDRAEQSALPRLRDALVQGLVGAAAAADATAQLSAWFAIDFVASGATDTTLVAQAIDSLLAVADGVRNHGFPAGHPATSWTVTNLFDPQFPWFLTYQTWTAALETYLYPENHLLPSLKPTATASFIALAEAVGGAAAYTPDQAEQDTKFTYGADTQDGVDGAHITAVIDAMPGGQFITPASNQDLPHDRRSLGERYINRWQ